MIGTGAGTAVGTGRTSAPAADLGRACPPHCLRPLTPAYRLPVLAPSPTLRPCRISRLGILCVQLLSVVFLCKSVYANGYQSLFFSMKKSYRETCEIRTPLEWVKGVRVVLISGCKLHQEQQFETRRSVLNSQGVIFSQNWDSQVPL
jgi:hypothetical protein